MHHTLYKMFTTSMRLLHDKYDFNSELSLLVLMEYFVKV